MRQSGRLVWPCDGGVQPASSAEEELLKETSTAQHCSLTQRACTFYSLEPGGAVTCEATLGRRPGENEKQLRGTGLQLLAAAAPHAPSGP